MGIEQTIFTTVKQALEQDSTLKNYVQKVYDGLRSFDDSFVPETIKNYIVLEPLSANETYPIGHGELPDQGIPKTVTIAIGIVGVITSIKHDNFSFVTDEGKYKGILGIDEDIKNAIDNSNAVRALADGEVNITTQSFIFETFPKRKVVMELTLTRTFRKGAR